MPTTRLRLSIASGVATILALSGCGDADPVHRQTDQPAVEAPVEAVSTALPVTAAPERAVDPCALVSKMDAERLAGTPLQDPAASPQSCTYTGPVTGPTAQVYVGDGAKKILDIDHDLGHDLRPLAGVGDEAYIEDGAVFVHAGGLWVAVRLVSLDDPAASRQPLQDLARTVVTRL